MNALENFVVRQLPEHKKEKIFEKYFDSPSITLVTTSYCTQEVFDKMTNLFCLSGFSWLEPLNTSTSRELFLGKLGQVSSELPDVVFKKSRFGHDNVNTSSFQPGSAANEIRTNLFLNAVVQDLTQSGELYPPDGFESLAVSIEQPLGILVDKKDKCRYSIFVFEHYFDLGEVLQYTEPPMQGAIFYNPQDWKTFCGVKDVLDRIIEAALKRGLVMQDYDVHQVLYRSRLFQDAHVLELVLIDSERFRILKKRV